MKGPKKEAQGTISLWFDDVDLPKYRAAPANQPIDTDICIIGAGIAGLTTAYLALEDGHSIIVLDERQIGGETGRTTAHLASASDDRFYEIERMHGKEAARVAYESHAAAIDEIERIAREEKIECEFARLNGYLSAAPGDSPTLLDKELAAAKRAGAKVEKLARGKLDSGSCLKFANQARFHPVLYLAGVAEAIKRKGGKIYTGKRVIDVQGTDPKKKTPARITLQGIRKTITAKHVVVATNTPAPINDWFGIYTKQASYRSYVIGAPVPKNTIEDALYWDTGDPYHYVRLEPRQGKSDLLIVGGEDHKTGQFPEGEDPFEKLEKWARKHFHKMGKVTYRWSGQVQEPADGLAFLGRALTAKEEVFVITGDSGMGLTHGTVGAILITDQISGRPNPWIKLYDPARKIVNTEFLKENANAVAQYTDLVTPGEISAANEIPKGEGALLRAGLKKLAVYRDETGKIHKCSALCTHLQCVVHWNPIEKSWDCPCHGSRFDPRGKVLIGPAIDDLPPVK